MGEAPLRTLPGVLIRLVLVLGILFDVVRRILEDVLAFHVVVVLLHEGLIDVVEELTVQVEEEHGEQGDVQKKNDEKDDTQNN